VFLLSYSYIKNLNKLIIPLPIVVVKNQYPIMRIAINKSIISLLLPFPGVLTILI